MSFPRLPPSLRGEAGIAVRGKLAQEHMAPGSMRGRAVAAQPPKQRQAGSVLNPSPFEAVFSQAGAATAGESSPYPVRVSSILRSVTISAGTTASTSSVLTVYVNGSSAGTVTLPSSNTTATGALSAVPVVPGDQVTVELTTIGTGLASVVAVVDGGRLSG